MRWWASRRRCRMCSSSTQQCIPPLHSIPVQGGLDLVETRTNCQCRMPLSHRYRHTQDNRRSGLSQRLRHHVHTILHSIERPSFAVLACTDPFLRRVLLRFRPRQYRGHRLSHHTIVSGCCRKLFTHRYYSLVLIHVYNKCRPQHGTTIYVLMHVTDTIYPSPK